MRCPLRAARGRLLRCASAPPGGSSRATPEPIGPLEPAAPARCQSLDSIPQVLLTDRTSFQQPVIARGREHVSSGSRVPAPIAPLAVTAPGARCPISGQDVSVEAGLRTWACICSGAPLAADYPAPVLTALDACLPRSPLRAKPGRGKGAQRCGAPAIAGAARKWLSNNA